MSRFLTEMSNLLRSSAPKRRRAFSVEILESRALLSSTAVISWKMAPRIVLDPAHGNAPSLPNTPAYVSPEGGYKVLLDATKTPGLRPRSTFNWAISESGQVIASVQGKKSSVSLPEGPYSVQLTVNGVRGSKDSLVASQDITINNVLIVAIGDSYASGEGNPVVDGRYFLRSPKWAYSPDPAMNLQNAQGHRSTLAAPAQFALKLQKNNPHEAVTFVSVANSGATIDEGLLGPMTSRVDDDYILPGQIEQVKDIVGSQPIDVLTVSIGGNDIGFSTRLKELASNSILGGTTLSEIQTRVNTDLATLPQKYASLGRAIKGLNPGNVLITDYPDLTRNQKGQYAPIDLMGLDAISKENVQFADQNIRMPLNQNVETAAAANGWTAVGSLDASFLTHGYSSTDSWFRSVGESLKYESSVIGAFHPNMKGQQAIADRLLAAYDQTFVSAAH
ncbi:SGNH/GDSL hydrolase family protein [Singulisphaera sp. Ch08]|uniref:SGNH/GDSL hydrolase family protein n=1 Tax=Singulisphaera sp. Ch08 TaxID=3120278 RepID=A0AAU7CKB6_9BACT